MTKPADSPGSAAKSSRPDHLSHQIKKAMFLAVKIGLGSALAIYIATMLGMESPTAAGTVTLLTLVTTKKGTVRLIAQRYLSLVFTLALCCVLFALCSDHFFAFGIFLIFIVLVTEMAGWSATLSVNALIGMHCMGQPTLDTAFIWNECLLLTIGVVMAFCLSQFNTYKSTRRHLYACIRHTELEMQELLSQVVRYIHAERHIHPWQQLEQLQNDLEIYLKTAQSYQDDTFSSAPECFISYFKMRQKQLDILENLHVEVRRIRSMPEPAHTLASYIEYLIPHVRDHNAPEPQMIFLQELIDSALQPDSISSRQSFEDHASLYHILMDLEDFLYLKKNFMDSMNSREKEFFFSDSAYASSTMFAASTRHSS